MCESLSKLKSASFLGGCHNVMKIFQKYLKLRLPLLLMMLMSTPMIASAQWMDSWGTSWNNPISQSLGNMLHQNAMWGVPLPVSGSSSKSTRSQSKSSEADLDALGFRRARGGRAAAEVVKAFKIENANQEQLLAFFREIAIAYDKSAKELSAENNLAYAVTVFTLSMVYINNAIADDVDPLTERNVFDAVSGRLSMDSTLVRMSDWDKQELHDRLVYTTGLVAAGYAHARQTRDQKRVQLFRSMAGELFRSVYNAEASRFSVADNRLVYR